MQQPPPGLNGDRVLVIAASLCRTNNCNALRLVAQRVPVVQFRSPALFTTEVAHSLTDFTRSPRFIGHPRLRLTPTTPLIPQIARPYRPLLISPLGPEIIAVINLVARTATTKRTRTTCHWQPGPKFDSPNDFDRRDTLAGRNAIVE